VFVTFTVNVTKVPGAPSFTWFGDAVLITVIEG
jgi:hypothetical protein